MRILLVHGLGRTPFSLFGLAASLRKAGHHTQFFCYSATFERLTGIVQRLRQRLQKLALSKQPVGLIGHSLGGLLLRLALNQVPALQVHHFIMLGTPNHSPLMARLAWKWFFFRLFAGECGRFLSDPQQYASVVVSLRETNPSVVVSSVVVSLRETNPSVVVSLRETNPSVVVSLRETNPHAERADYTEQFVQLASPVPPHTVIAGTGGVYGRYSPFGDEPNDGLVSVSEARIDDGCQVVQLPVWHSTMMDDFMVRQRILDLFKA